MTIIIITFFFTFSKIVNCFFFNFKFGTVFRKSYSEIETELDDMAKKQWSNNFIAVLLT
jgi:hypothetical protein